MKYDELIRTCTEALKGFNDKFEGPDSFLEKFLKSVMSIKLLENQGF